MARKLGRIDDKARPRVARDVILVRLMRGHNFDGAAMPYAAEAVRYRAIRGKWPRMRGNDGHARVQVPDERPSYRPAHPHLGPHLSRTPAGRNSTPADSSAIRIA